MDQIKTGRLIAVKRKEKGLTQADVASRLGISDRAVSKWERGLCLPDASLMLPLCSILGISVEDLLQGEVGNGDTDGLLVELKAKAEKADRRLLDLEWVIGGVSFTSFFALILTAGLIVHEVSAPVAIILIVLACAIMGVGIWQALLIEWKAGWYECPLCHSRHVPSLAAMVFSPHMGRTRYLRCPKCAKRAWQRKVTG